MKLQFILPSLVLLFACSSPRSTPSDTGPDLASDVQVDPDAPPGDDLDTGTATDALAAETADVEAEPKPFIEGCTGFPCANFAVSAEVTPQGELFKRILWNRPELGSWLEEWGGAEFVLESHGRRWTAADCSSVQVQRAWPQATAEWADPELAVSLKAEAWAPVVKGDVASTALPVLVARLGISGPAGEPVALEFHVNRQGSFEGTAASTSDATGRLDAFADFGLGWEGLESGDVAAFKAEDSHNVYGRVELTLPDSGKRTVTVVLLLWHPDCRAAADWADLPALFAGLRPRLAELETATRAFPDSLPSSGDDKVDEYLRWYMTAGVMLTRVLKDDTTLTMGYAELNQRDSFWTSFMHLLYWPEAEGKMIEESAAAVAENGKVPTCILPVIEREDDIDINEYFLLRVGRYYRASKDLDFLQGLFPACELALQYLIGRCAESSALPEQQSSWADWKDVGGVTGRKYGPHFVLLYLATLKEMAYLARELGENVLADSWAGLLEAADEQANLSVQEGGLWNGAYYVNVWRDDREDNALLEDQLVAGVWGVIPPERFASIRAALNETNERDWGVRETFPYYPNEFGYEGGDYHNGAVWPWLNFADAIARSRYGFRDDALRIMSKVGHWDLEVEGDYLPHENLHGETGHGIRHYVQGWDAGYLGAIVWGLNGEWPAE